MRARDLLTLTPAGLYCLAGDFHIDPTRPTPRAIITHAHSDHARAGHGRVLATRETLDIMAIRCGAHHARETQALAYGDTVRIGDVSVRLHPAGHVLGSAQIAITGQQAGARETIVVSGDYKRQADLTCAPFEVAPCTIFITEATFGLPVFQHPATRLEVGKLIASRDLFPERAHLVGVYSLGKAQRLMAEIRAAGYDRPLYLHGALERVTAYYEQRGQSFGDVRKVAASDRAALGGEIVLCPPSALNDVWSQKFPDPVHAFASGWMRIRAHARQRGVELPLVVSDHADWPDLCETIAQTGCEEVWITHGEEQALMRWAELTQRRARPLHLLGYGDEEDESAEATDA